MLWLKTSGLASNTFLYALPFFKKSGVRTSTVVAILFFLICVISYFSNKSLWFQIEMRKNRFFINSQIIKLGEWIFCILMFIFFIFFVFFIFYNHNFEVDSQYNSYLFWLRICDFLSAKTSILCLTLLLFPISKFHQLWIAIFQCSYEHSFDDHAYYSPHCTLVKPCLVNPAKDCQE